MEVKVDEEKCIGCGVCAALAGEVFELDNDTMKAKVKDGDHSDKKEEIKKVASSCPVGAIIVKE